MLPLLPEATAAAGAVLLAWFVLLGWDRRDRVLVIVILAGCVVIESAWLAFLRYRLMQLEPHRYVFRIRRIP